MNILFVYSWPYQQVDKQTPTCLTGKKSRKMTASYSKAKTSSAFVEKVGVAFKVRRFKNQSNAPYAFKSRVVFNQSDSEIEDRFRQAFTRWTRQVSDDSANV